ncbi:hypothetical protein K443DRAFT_686168 [Laccaria amethystina LaAM-08-1]|uniref:Uncharacterized protein n=1 Tax=Laccaria amethystina LaAM-08-1 TaxID=1095629 RepID=A0A0C9X123_9AGAR|nr:hypothetical protein K443DRAFT_686168 [Laccaria amethystina LaAM-08-1]
MSNVTLDDRDTSITYSTGQWGQAGSTNEFDSTTTWTSLRGATAQVSFNGTSIGVYGTIVQKGLLQDPISSYTVDSNTPVVFTGKSQATIQYKQLFFQSPTLSAGTHTLTITNNVDGDQLFLDFLSVVPSDPSSSSASSSSTSSTSSLSTSTSETKSTTSAIITPTVPVTVTVTQRTSSTAAASSQTGKSVASTSNGGNSGAIVGGVVGGVVLLALFVVAFFFVRQRRRRAEMDEALNGSNFWDPQPSHDMSTEALKPPPRSYPSYPSMSQAKSDSNHFIPYQTTGDSSQYHGPQVQYQPPQGQYQTPQMQYQNPQIQYQHPQNQYQTPPNQYPTAPSRYQTQSPYRPATYAQNQYPGPADYTSPPSPSELPYHSGSDVTSPGAGGPNRYLPPSQAVANEGHP